MSILHAIILAIIQGITEFLPVSSFGHLVILENILQIKQQPGILYEMMLHTGTAAAVVFVFRKDFRQMIMELLGMCADLLGNIHLWLHNKKNPAHLQYNKIICNRYRKFNLLVLISCIPSAIIGYTAKDLAILASSSSFFSGIGILITGIILLVTDFSNSGGKKGIREARPDHAMWMGISQGVSVFPGFSRCGLTMSAALFCGLSRSFALKFSFIMSVPAILGGMISELPSFTLEGMSAGTGFIYVLGMIITWFVSMFTIRFLLKLTKQIKFRYFAFYCFLAGLCTLFGK